MSWRLIMKIITHNEYFEEIDWQGKGFLPLVTSNNWLVAKMNWEERFNLNNLSTLERHNNTDEVFILVQGEAILLIKSEQGAIVKEMKKNIIYNIKKTVWHHVIGTKDASWIIVESDFQHDSPTEYYYLLEKEKEIIKELLPDW